MYVCYAHVISSNCNCTEIFFNPLKITPTLGYFYVYLIKLYRKPKLFRCSLTNYYIDQVRN